MKHVTVIFDMEFPDELSDHLLSMLSGTSITDAIITGFEIIGKSLSPPAEFSISDMRIIDADSHGIEVYEIPPPYVPAPNNDPWAAQTGTWTIRSNRVIVP